MHPSTLLEAGFPSLAPTYNVENLPPTPKNRVKWYLDVAGIQHGLISQTNETPTEKAFAVTVQMQKQEFIEKLRNAWGSYVPNIRFLSGYENAQTGVYRTTVLFLIPK